MGSSTDNGRSAPKDAREGGGAPRGRFRVGDWFVDPALNRIERSGKSIRVQSLSMQVLLFMAERAGAVVTYDELLQALWPRRHAGEDAVHRRIAALRSHFGDDARSPRYIETVPKRGYRIVAPIEWQPAASPPPHDSRIPGRAVAAGAVVLVSAAILLTSPWDRWWGDVPADSSRTEDVAADEIRFDLVSSPSDAEVAFRPYADPAAPWQPLGVTPLRSTLPEGAWVLRLMADGRDTVKIAVRNPGIELNNIDAAPYTISLPKSGTVPQDMIYIPEYGQPVPLWGFTTMTDIGEYYIGRKEVTNSEFAEFVAADGYRDPAFWRGLLESDDAFAFQDVAARFTDSTGAPGPAGWIDGDFRAGTEDLPVTGVSWYEAMAYARFRGMTLPAGPHWARAALGVIELDKPFAPTLLAAANLDGAGPLPASDEHAMSPSGALNMVGNVREWTRSYSGRQKLTLGQSFSGQDWGYAMPTMADPLTRLPIQGFRLAKYDEAKFLSWQRPLALDGLLPRMPDVTDEAYATILDKLRYEPGHIGAKDIRTLSEVDEGSWTRRKILIPTSHPDEPLPVVMFLPKGSRRPLQALVYLTPGSRGPTSINSDDVNIRRYQIELVLESGRAIVWPILYGTHERYAAEIHTAPTREEAGRLRDVEILRHRDETGRLIDYMEASPIFDGSRIGMLAASGGAIMISPYLLAAESRFRAVVYLGAGLAAVDPERVPLLRNPNTYWQRLTLPAFFAHGRYDVAARFAPPDSVGGTLFEVFGTPKRDKRLAVYEMAHWPFSPLLLGQDLLPWLDEYLGPVE